MDKKGIGATLIVIMVGLSILILQTDYLHAFTQEQARRIRIEKEKPLLPNVTFQDSEGETFQLEDLQGSYILATFIYTSCGDLCPVIEMNFKELYKQIPKQWKGEDLRFLSISFDPSRDDPEALKKYQNIFHADGATWKMVRVPNQEELNRLLKNTGVIVIPNEQGGFTHNAAFYLIDDKSRLVKVFDYNHPKQVAKQLESYLEGDAS